MKKVFKSRVFIVIITMIICISGTLYATTKYQASEVSYTPINSDWNVNNVNDAINSLYDMKIELNNIKSIGDATSSDIATGKTAVVQGKLVTGTSEVQTNEKGMYILHQTDSNAMSYTFEEDMPMGVLLLWYAQAGGDSIQDTTVNISSGSQTVLVNKTSYVLLSYPGYGQTKTWSRCKVILLTNIPKGATLTTDGTANSSYGATATLFKPYNNDFSKMEVLKDSNSNISSYTFNKKTPYALVVEWNGQGGGDFTNDTYVILSSGTQKTLIDKTSYMKLTVGTVQNSWSRCQIVLLTNVPEGATLDTKGYRDYSGAGATTTILIPGNE